MSRYNTSGSSTSNDSNYDDDVTLKLQQYAAIRGDGGRVNAFSGNWGDKLIVGFDDVEVVDGIVFQRQDKPMTVKVFPASKFHNLNPEDGRVYENYEDGQYSGELSADEILESPKVQGFFEEFGGEDYEYDPIGVVIEAADDIAIDNDVVGGDGPITNGLAEEATAQGYIPLGDVSMILGNQSWVRTLAKKLTAQGDDIINDVEGADYEDNPKYADREWLTTMTPALRSELEGRTMELWITEETREYDDGEQTYTTPNLLDTKTGNWVTIDNGVSSEDGGASGNSDEQTNHQRGEDEAEDHDEPAADPEPEAAAATDGGTATASADGLPGDVPEVLDDLLDYFARTQGGAEADELREFAEDEVDDADDVDWEAAAAEVESRA